MFFKQYTSFLLKFRALLLIGLSALTAYLAVQACGLPIHPSMETLFEKKSADYLYYREYREKFGSDQLIAVAMQTPNLFTKSNLDKLKQVTRGLSELSSVERVVSLANVRDIIHVWNGVKERDLLQNLQGVNFTGLKNRVVSNELFEQNLVSRDAKTANILVYLRGPGSEEEGTSKNSAVEDIRHLLRKLESTEIRFYVAGSPVEQHDFVKLIRRDQMLFIPLIALLLVTTTWWIYRSFACMAVSMTVVLVTLAWTLGMMKLWGGALELMTSLLPPVIMIITIVNVIHILNTFFEMRFRTLNLRQAILRTMAKKTIPCFLAQFTTVLGFLSLCTNSVPAIQHFGLYTAWGSACSFLVSITITPLLLPLLPAKRVGESTIGQWFLNYAVVRFLERLEFRWKWPIAILTVAICLLGWQGMKTIRIDSNLIKQMKPNLDLAISTRFIDEHVTGVYSMGFVMKRHDRKPMTDSASLRAVDSLKEYLESLPGITKVNAITSVIRRIEEVVEGSPGSNQIPQSPGRLKRIWKGLTSSDAPELWTMISKDLKEVRLDVRVRALGTDEGSKIDEDAKRFVKDVLSNDYEVTQTGNVVLLGRIAKHLVEEQVESFGLAFFSILFLICILFRSWTMGIFAALPSLFPIVVVYGGMGFLGIELSTTTAMISSIVMGMVVDASIHFIYHFREEFMKRYHYLGAMHQAFQTVAPSLIVSTGILAAGFLSSVLGNFLPTIYFGVLTSMSLILSLVSALIILPVMIVMLKPFGRQRLFVPPTFRRGDSVADDFREDNLESPQAIPAATADHWT